VLRDGETEVKAESCYECELQAEPFEGLSAEKKEGVTKNSPQNEKLTREETIDVRAGTKTRVGAGGFAA